MADYLMLFSISPVQSFISNSRKTQDLYNGSRVLSDLIKMLLEFLINKDGIKVIFPKHDSKYMPNRLLIRVKADNDNYIYKLGKDLEDKFKAYILKFSFDIMQESNELIRSQINEYFQSHWTAIKIEKSYIEAYKELERKHAGIKNLRIFRQLGNGSGEQGRKCSLCGENNAILYKDNSIKPAFINENAISRKSNLIKANEAICTVCALKRFGNSPNFPSTSEIAMKGILLPKEIEELKKLNIDPEMLYNETDVSKYVESENEQDTLRKAEQLKKSILERCEEEGKSLPKYYALIIYDGDYMGNLLSGSSLKDEKQLEEFHSELAASLSINSEESSAIVDQVGGTVYAGGDDFLGFCILEKLLPTLKNLRQSFEEKVSKKLQHFLKPSSEITMSAGVVIAHYKTPLHIVLDWARKMENESKNRGGKNSITLAVLKHSGDLQKTTWQWGNTIDKMHFVLEQLNSGNFSTNFVYTLEKEFRKIDYEANISYDRQFETELKRLLKRSIIEKCHKNEEIADQMCDACLDLKSMLHSVKEYFDLMRILAFFHREQGGIK